MKKISGGLRIQLAQFRELAAFAQFGSDLDKATQSAITRGQRMTELLKQPEFQPVPVEEQVVALYAGASGAIDDVPLNRVHEFEKQYIAFLRSSHADVLASLRDEKKWTDALQKKCDELCKQFKAQFLA
jgi:F-type H+-transporting ATPase subunit alpha